MNPQLPPHSQDAEEALLSGLFIAPDMLAQIEEFLKPDDFFFLRNTMVYEAMLHLHQRNETINTISVAERLENQQRLDQVGGAAYMTYLLSCYAGGLYDVEVFARIVERTAARRRLLKAGGEIQRLALDEAMDTVEALDAAQGELDKVNYSKQTDGLEPLSVLVSRDWDKMQLLEESGGITGLSTGLKMLDGQTGGVEREDTVILAGRPGMGKTSTLLTIANNVGKKGGKVAIISMEMSKSKIIRRMIAMLSNISLQRLKTGLLTKEEWSRYNKAADELAALPIFVDDTYGPKPQQALKRLLRLQDQIGELDLVVMDHLGEFWREPKEMDYAFYTRNAEGCRGIAKTLGTRVLLAAQLNRAVEGRDNKRPTMADLRGSGRIEEIADQIWLLYREEKILEINVAKNRDGAPSMNGPVKLGFELTSTKVTNIEVQSIDLEDYT